MPTEKLEKRRKLSGWLPRPLNLRLLARPKKKLRLKKAAKRISLNLSSIPVPGSSTSKLVLFYSESKLRTKAPLCSRLTSL